MVIGGPLAVVNIGDLEHGMSELAAPDRLPKPANVHFRTRRRLKAVPTTSKRRPGGMYNVPV